MFPEADTIKTARKRANWSQRDLAEHADVHIQTVKYWERQDGSIAGYAVDRFEEAFEEIGISLSDILWDEQEARREAFRRNQPTQKYRPSLCGAQTRRGRPCRNEPFSNGRCKFHGGISTGPKTQAGRDRIAAAQRKRWAKAE
ncbi:MAG: helix-turn-helix transcriptional regulator [Stappiaceae bacterium]